MPVERVKIRESFFAPIFKKLAEILPEIYGAAQFDAIDYHALCELFFLISDAYKFHRVEPDHFTNDYKKAGLTIAAIMAMRPIRIIDAANNPRAFYANPIFGIYCAIAILKKPISSMPEEEREQFYLWLDQCQFPSSSKFLRTVETGNIPNDFDPIHLTQSEVSTIDMIIQHLINRCRIYDPNIGIDDDTSDP